MELHTGHHLIAQLFGMNVNMHTNYPQIGQDIKAKKEMTGETEAALVKAVAEFTREYGASHQLIKEEE